MKKSAKDKKLIKRGGESIFLLKLEYREEIVEEYLKFLVYNSDEETLNQLLEAILYSDALYIDYLDGFYESTITKLPKNFSLDFKCFLTSYTLLEDIKRAKNIKYSKKGERKLLNQLFLHYEKQVRGVNL